MTVFFKMLDVAVIAAYVIWTTKITQRNDNKRCRRRIFLRQLGRSLSDSHLKQHSQNSPAVQQGTQLAVSNIGISMVRPVNTTELLLNLQFLIFLVVRTIIK